MLRVLMDELPGSPQEGENLQSSPPLLQARALRASLSASREIEISFTLEPARVLRVAGPSGSGKTTLLRLLARLSTREGGEILLRGRPAAQISPIAWRRQVLYLAQQPVMFQGTVQDNLAAGFVPSSAPRPPADLESRGRDLLASLGLDPSGELLAQDAHTLSGGEAARVALCRALLVEPAVLLADEPTAALDLDNARALVRQLASWVAGGRALVLVAHDATLWEGVAHQVVHLGDAGRGVGRDRAAEGSERT